MTRTRTGNAGDTFSFRADGRRMADTSRMTIAEMVEFSARWPDEWHQYRDPSTGYVTWAYRGTEIPADKLPLAIRNEWAR